MLRLLGGAQGAGAPTRGRRGAGHIVSPRAQLVNTQINRRTVTVLLSSDHVIKKVNRDVLAKGRTRRITDSVKCVHGGSET